MQLSKAAKRIKPSATLAINELITQRRKQGEQILHMGFGESPFPVHPLVSKALCENAGQKSYLATQGIKPLREQVSKFYEKMFNLQYPPEQIVVGPGSKVLLFDALVALDGPLFLPAPSWVSYQHQARLLEKEVYHVSTSPDDSYRLTPEALEQSLQQNTRNPWDQKVLLMNYPCNPTGHSFSAKQLKALASVAKDYNVIVLSDEIYGLVSFEGQEHHSIAEFYPEGTLVTGGLSKDRSLGGFRVGVMLFPEDEEKLLTSICSIGSETWSCVAAPVQYAAIQAYQTTPAILDFIRDCAQIHELATRYVYRQVHGAGIRCPPPQGAFYLMPDWNEHEKALKGMGITTSKELAETLLKKWNVASLPGSEFGMPPGNLCIRIATVDYDGENALQTFRENPRQALANPDEFVNTIAPRLVAACSQIKEFNSSIS